MVVRAESVVTCGRSLEESPVRNVVQDWIALLLSFHVSSGSLKDERFPVVGGPEIPTHQEVLSVSEPLTLLCDVIEV